MRTSLEEVCIVVEVINILDAEILIYQVFFFNEKMVKKDTIINIVDIEDDNGVNWNFSLVNKVFLHIIEEVVHEKDVHLI